MAIKNAKKISVELREEVISFLRVDIDFVYALPSFFVCHSCESRNPGEISSSVIFKMNILQTK